MNKEAGLYTPINKKADLTSSHGAGERSAGYNVEEGAMIGIFFTHY